MPSFKTVSRSGWPSMPSATASPARRAAAAPPPPPPPTPPRAAAPPAPRHPAQPPRQVRDRLQHRPAGRVSVAAGHEVAVDLQQVGLAVEDHAEARGAEADVVEGDAHAEVAQLVEGGAEAR